MCDLRTSQGPRDTAPDSCPPVVWAVIADVHGNYPALKAVLEDAERAGAGQYLLVGDYFTDLHYTRQVYELLRDLPGALLISGNREWYMGTLDPALRRREQTAGLYLTQRELGEDGLAWVKGLPKTARIATPDGKKAICMEHICAELYQGAPHSGTQGLSVGPLNLAYPHRDATHEEVLRFARQALSSIPELTGAAGRARADVIVHGHSHLQYAVEAGGVLYLNPGSCGQPLDHQAGAPYTLLSYEHGVFSTEERRVSYDVERAVWEYRRSPMYREAKTWCEFVIEQLLARRSYMPEFFERLEEEQERVRPQTDEEHNEVLRHAFQLLRRDVISARTSRQCGERRGADVF